MPTPIHQLVHTLSYGDAISSEVLALQGCFRRLGVESEIFAINVHPRHQGKALQYEQFPETFTGQVVLHYSLGSPLNALYRRLSQARRSLIYHNITPARWFAGVNPRIVADIEQGLAELPELCQLSDCLIADSPFNAQELPAAKVPVQVLRLPVDPARWHEPRNQGIYDLLRAEPGPHILHVGRLAPNKCVEDIIKIFYFLHHSVEPTSKLWLVGIDIDTEIYSFALKRLVHELRLDGAVNFLGCLADSEVRALYEASSVYVCMSEHEGFCLPIVEAMHFGLPVVAYESSALADTVGSGGILVKEKRHAELAELVALLARDSGLRQRVQAAARERVAQLGFAGFENQVAQIFGTPVQKGTVTEAANLSEQNRVVGVAL
jgi:glycosyltransferase involved in cell wall biosynthesis